MDLGSGGRGRRPPPNRSFVQRQPYGLATGFQSSRIGIEPIIRAHCSQANQTTHNNGSPANRLKFRTPHLWNQFSELTGNHVKRTIGDRCRWNRRLCPKTFSAGIGGRFILTGRFPEEKTQEYPCENLKPALVQGNTYTREFPTRDCCCDLQGICVTKPLPINSNLRSRFVGSIFDQQKSFYLLQRSEKH